MSETLTDCTECNSKDSLEKVVNKISQAITIKAKPGDLVKKAIHEAKLDFHADGKKYRKELK